MYMSTRVIKLNRYIIRQDLIARGGMAEVFRAKIMGAFGFEKVVALKRILPEFIDTPAFQSMFLSEAKVMSSLVHPNIVQVIDFFKDNKDVYLVMEYIFGRNLRQILKRQKEKNTLLPIPVALHVVLEVARGLAYAHEKQEGDEPLKIVHRDINPQNIMMTFGGEIKIVDFGIAKFQTKAEKTATGILKGKFGYMSPEQVEGLSLDERSDVFSLGVVLYELLTGKKLFQADSEIQFVKMMETFKAPHTGLVRPEVVTELEEVLNKAIVKERPRRYQQAKIFAQDLHRILNTHYEGCRSEDCAALLLKSFKDEYTQEIAKMDEPSDMLVFETHETEASEAVLQATGTEGQTQLISSEEHTRPRIIKPVTQKKNWHEVTGSSGIRFKFALDPNRSWDDVQFGLAQGKANRQGTSKSLFKRWWQDPKKRKILILVGLLLLGVLWVFSETPDPKSSSDKSTAVKKTKNTPTK